ncbi:MAG TPA: transcriptional activator RfaH [Verrucomicrobiae bacterium]|nr:transcriptional activator RfaH [Verrucomicrobiae bacterium]
MFWFRAVSKPELRNGAVVALRSDPKRLHTESPETHSGKNSIAQNCERGKTTLLMNLDFSPAWYCARTKPKHEHIAAANLGRNLGLRVFNPQLRVERATQRGPVRSVEPLFPCYVFVHCSANELNDIRYVSGISSLVHFGDQVPTVPDSVIADLRECFASGEPMPVEDSLAPGAEVLVAEGAFCGFEAVVLRTMPARRRVQILLDILGRPTVVEVDRHSVSCENRSMADLLPSLAAA